MEAASSAIPIILFFLLLYGVYAFIRYNYLIPDIITKIVVFTLLALGVFGIIRVIGHL